MVSHLATSWGYEVVTAADGNEAWPRWNAAMPRRSPYSIEHAGAGWPGALPSHPRILTGRAGDEEIVAGLKAGADDYLIKPFSPEVLKWRLEAGRRMVKTQAELRRVARPIPILGDARSADDGLESRRNPRFSASGVGARRPQRVTGSGHHGGPRSLQTDQRHLGTRRRRFGIARDQHSNPQRAARLPIR